MKSKFSALHSGTFTYLAIAATLLLLLLVLFLTYYPPTADIFTTFTAIFVEILVQALPFLLVGCLAGGVVEAFLGENLLERMIPRSTLGGAIFGSLLGLFFPIGECGVIPLARRLFRKGMPVSSGIAFLLAAPVINPIAIFSTAAALGFGKLLVLRVGCTWLTAIISGFILSAYAARKEIFQPIQNSPSASVPEEAPAISAKVKQAFQTAWSDFLDMGQYLILGGLIAAGLQTFIHQSDLLKFGSGTVLPVLVMMGLAIIQSICSTADPYVALRFTGIFSSSSILSYLVVGPMVDIKNILLFSRVFRQRATALLAIAPLVIVFLISLVLNAVIG